MAVVPGRLSPQLLVDHRRETWGTGTPGERGGVGAPPQAGLLSLGKAVPRTLTAPSEQTGRFAQRSEAFLV